MNIELKDSLTGLPNRKYIDTYILSRKNEMKNLGVPFGILFIDIDRFTKFNEVNSREAGDLILVMLSKVFKRAIRNSDLIGRWGDEKFLGIFSGVDLTSLLDIANKVRKMAENSSIEYKSKTLNITISIGATMVDYEEEIGEALERVNALLRKSKENGRNRVSS